MLRYSFTACVLLVACAASEDEIQKPELGYLERCGDPESPPSANACLFGDVFADIRSSPAVLVTSETWIRSVDSLTALEGQQLVLAVQQSSHTDVVTPAEALARVDQNEVRRMEFDELASNRRFVVYEYGVGDNSYGAYFPLERAEVVASIHDGDVLDCSVVSAESDW